jgi:hypothetical protein
VDPETNRVIGQHLPPDYSRGDETTVGGYAAVHGRPPALVGQDGLSYSVDVLVDETGQPSAPWGAYLLFVRWSPGRPALAGHVESDFLVRARTPADARAQLGAWPLIEVKRVLDGLTRSGPGGE